MEKMDALVSKLTAGKLRVTFNGDVTGTKIHTEAGEDISNQVRTVRFEHRAGDIPVVWIEILLPVGEVAGPVDPKSEIVDMTGHSDEWRRVTVVGVIQDAAPFVDYYGVNGTTVVSVRREKKNGTYPSSYSCESFENYGLLREFLLQLNPATVVFMDRWDSAQLFFELGRSGITARAVSMSFAELAEPSLLLREWLGSNPDAGLGIRKAFPPEGLEWLSDETGHIKPNFQTLSHKVDRQIVAAALLALKGFEIAR